MSDLDFEAFSHSALADGPMRSPACTKMHLLNLSFAIAVRETG